MEYRVIPRIIVYGGPGSGKSTLCAKIAEIFQVVHVFFKDCQAQNLRKNPRRPCGPFWYHLELQGPQFDRSRPNFQFFCSAVSSRKV